jgi:O-antigen ligase
MPDVLDAIASGAVVRWGLVALIAFTPLAFGTVEGWSIALLEWGIVTVALAALAERRLAPAPEGASRRTGVEWPLGLYLGLVCLQLLPIPAALTARVAPGAQKAHEAAVVAPSGGVATAQDFEALRGSLDLRPPASWRPLSVNEGETWAKGRLLATLLLLFFVASSWAATRERALFLVRAILVTGFSVALFGIVQHLTWNGKLYWLRPAPRDSGFGPFVNHNHFAGYVEMVMPLAIAMAYYLVSRRGRRSEADAFEGDDEADLAGGTAALDDSQEAAGRWGQWTLALFAAVVLLGSLVLSGSRGGLLSAVLGGGILFAVLWRRIRPRALAWSVAAALPILAALLAAWIGTDVLRVGDAGRSVEREASFHSRWVIWKEVARRLPEAGAAGFGLGTFEESFAPYTPRGTAQRWDRAHNDYLQIAWETGGLGVLLILWGGLLFGWAYVAPALRGAGHPLDLFRVAVAVSLASLLLHSIVDFNLQIGSNAFLFALLAGLLVALHRVVARESGAGADPAQTGAGQGLRLHVASEPRILGAGDDEEERG